jgi:hypothetical protein
MEVAYSTALHAPRQALTSTWVSTQKPLREETAKRGFLPSVPSAYQPGQATVQLRRFVAVHNLLLDKRAWFSCCYLQNIAVMQAIIYALPMGRPCRSCPVVGPERRRERQNALIRSIYLQKCFALRDDLLTTRHLAIHHIPKASFRLHNYA